MQSLIHGNFEGKAQKATYALVGAAAAIAAAVGPLIGGFITTFLSYRVAFLLEVVVIAIVLSGSRLVRDVPYTGPRQIDLVGARPVGLRHGRSRPGHPRVAGGRRGRRPAARRSAPSRWPRFAYWLVRRKREGKPTLIDPDLFKSELFRLGISGQMLQKIALGGAMITMPIYLQMVLEYNALQAGLSLAPLSLSMFAAAILAGKRSGRPPAEQHHPGRLRAPADRHAPADPDRAPGRRRLVPGRPAGDRRASGSDCWSPSSTTTRWRRSRRSGSARPPA